MKNHLGENSQRPAPASGVSNFVPEKHDEATHHAVDSRSPFLHHRRRLATGRRGVALYHVRRLDGTAQYWETETTHRGALVTRRFASELHARVWVHLMAEPRFTLSSFDLEEVHASLRRPRRSA